MQPEILARLFVAFLIGVIAGLRWPQLCPRCYLEQKWINKTISDMKKEIGKRDG